MFRFSVLYRVFHRRASGFVKLKHVWTQERVVKSPLDDIKIPDTTIAEYVWKDLDKFANKTAVVCGISDRQYTFLQIYKQSQILGAGLRKRFKIKDGDAVVVMLPNIPEFPIVLMGILSAGGIVSTVNPLYTAYEVQRQILMSDAKLIIVLPETVAVIKEALKLCKLDIPVVSLDVVEDKKDDTVSFKELVADNNLDLSILTEVNRKSEDVSLLLYSSGTTGLPKGVELINRNIVANFEQQSVDEFRYYAETTETNQDIVLGNLPMFHSYGLSTVTLHKLSAGLKLVTVPRFQPETFVGILDKHKLNLLYLTPPTVLFLASSPSVKPSHFDKLKAVTVGAAPLPKADVDRFLSKVDHEIHFAQAYGLTETSPLATMNPIGSNNYSLVGCALPNVQLRVVDGETKNLGANELGELLIKGPNVMKGYRNNEEANSQVFVEDGWMRSGDLAKIDENGFVTIADRIKELIKVNAYQVPPAELENVLKEHPAVLDAAVIGIPDEKTGQKPKAYVVLNKGFNVNAEDILNHVSERVAPYKKIKEIEFTDSILKNPSGKILRRVLLEQSLKTKD